MINYIYIFVVVEFECEIQLVLLRVVELVGKIGVSIIVFMIIYDFFYEMMIMLLGEECEVMCVVVVKECIEWFMEQFVDYLGNIQVVVEWDNWLYEVIICYVINDKVDIVVKVMCFYDDFCLVIFIFIDWYLVCKCFIFVLLVKDYDWLVDGNIIVVVNVGIEDCEYV